MDGLFLQKLTNEILTPLILKTFLKFLIFPDKIVRESRIKTLMDQNFHLKCLKALDSLDNEIN